MVKKNKSQLWLLIGLVVVALMIPLVIKLAQKSAETRSSAHESVCQTDADCEKIDYCVGGKCWCAMNISTKTVMCFLKGAGLGGTGGSGAISTTPRSSPATRVCRPVGWESGPNRCMSIDRCCSPGKLVYGASKSCSCK